MGGYPINSGSKFMVLFSDPWLPKLVIILYDHGIDINCITHTGITQIDI